MRYKREAEKEYLKKFGSLFPVPNEICSECGERYGDHAGHECPKDFEKGK